MAKAVPPLYVSPASRDRAEAETWLEEYVIAGLDGVVAKRLDSVYRPGEREMRKLKNERTADTVLIGWRWAKGARGAAVGSLRRPASRRGRAHHERDLVLRSPRHRRRARRRADRRVQAAGRKSRHDDGVTRNSRRHCERSEAIQDVTGRLDCFVARAPRNDGLER